MPIDLKDKDLYPDERAPYNPEANPLDRVSAKLTAYVGKGMYRPLEDRIDKFLSSQASNDKKMRGDNGL